MSFTIPKPKRRKRNRTHGFLSRQKTTSGRKIHSRKRAKNRKSISV